MSSTAMSSTAMAGILESSRELDRLKKEQEDVLVEINKLHKKLQTTPEVVEKLGDTSLSKLKHLYTHAKELSEAEVTYGSLLVNSVMMSFFKPHLITCLLAQWASTVMLNQLDTLLLSGPPGQPRRKIDSNDQKRKRMKNDSEISRMSSSMRSQLEVFASLKGQQVAARVTEDADKDEWFIVKVTNFDRETREFEVLDEEPGDDEESGGQRKYKVPVSHIIPFPKQNDPSGAQDFPSGSHVLAVYPGTTALYKATVVNSRKRKTEDYLLEFDDDEEDGAMPQRNVPFYNVVPLPEGHRQ
ncbi:SAGA-associated factor 29 homolog A isoform X1 [Rhodamnia argentea]|uniref:SAGA-associated factor 29 homolog A isoform X1 n=1 Tax=Rhodamnia argentea TaxID=178133 RepID=A0ABM3HU41_9MYRT|nr:SAGA-associated factor 29 homolog A isoform X1 [Rhodamnia argentea]